MSPFWQGFLLFPFVACLVAAVGIFLARQWAAIFHWYIGIPLVRWFAMGLVILGLKFLQRKSCSSLRANGKIWLSPNVDYFQDKETIR